MNRLGNARQLRSKVLSLVGLIRRGRSGGKAGLGQAALPNPEPATNMLRSRRNSASARPPTGLEAWLTTSA